MSAIAIIPGDGIGPEVCAVAERVLAEVDGAQLEAETFPWGSAHYLRTGRMRPPGATETDDLGRGESAGRVRAAVASACAAGIVTPDVGGSATTSEVADAILRGI